MRLADALRLAPGRTAAFVGAGGKTSAIARLVRELRLELPVLVTTSTKIGRDQIAVADQHRIVTHAADLEGLTDLLREQRSVVLTGPLSATEPKWLGLDPEILEHASRMARAVGGCILVEADGASGASLKAPADHEPVIPEAADLVVPVAGLDVLGSALAEPGVHRPQLVAAIVGKPVGERVEADDLVRVLRHPAGGLKGVPVTAEVRVLLNKVDAAVDRSGVEAIAVELLATRAIQAVIAAQSSAPEGYCEVFARVAGVILAAGGSKRLGRPKQLLLWRGRPLVWHAVQAAREGGLSPIIVVCGAEGSAIRAALHGEPVEFADNPDWEQGLSTSMRCGLESAGAAAEAVIFLLSDTPLVDGALVRELCRTHRRSLAPIVAPQTASRLANPVLFDRATFAALRQVTGDRGGSAVFDQFRVTGVPWEARILIDVDTPEDQARLESQA